MNTEILEKGNKLEDDIYKIKMMLSEENLHIWNGYYHGNGLKAYTTDEINIELHRILTEELAKKEKEFEEL